LTIFDINVNLTLDLLTSRTKQFIFILKQHWSCKFGEIPTSGFWSITFTTFNIWSHMDTHTHMYRELKIECILWLTASKGKKMASAGTLHMLNQVRHDDKGQ